MAKAKKEEEKKVTKPEVKEEKKSEYNPDLPENKQRWLR